MSTNAYTRALTPDDCIPSGNGNTASYMAEASTLEIPPGQRPPAEIRTRMGNGRALVLERVDRDGTAYYAQPGPAMLLRVFND